MPQAAIIDLAASLATLTFLEIVLGIDNIVFLAVAVERLDPAERAAGRRIGLALAAALRIGLLFALVWVARMDVALFHLFGEAFTIKDVVLIGGGVFLLAKGTTEIHATIEAAPAGEHSARPTQASFAAVMVQITFINVIFSLDSVITAVGMTSNLMIMVTAVLLSTAVMVFAARPVADFIHHRPTTKLLALSFVLLIGMALVADGLGFHLPREYLYFAIAFSLFVECLNIAYQKARARSQGGGSAAR